MARWMVKEVAEKQGFNAYKLALEAKLSYNTVRPIWLGKVKLVHLDTLASLASALGVRTCDLISDEAPAPEDPAAAAKFTLSTSFYTIMVSGVVIGDDEFASVNRQLKKGDLVTVKAGSFVCATEKQKQLVRDAISRRRQSIAAAKRTQAAQIDEEAQE